MTDTPPDPSLNQLLADLPQPALASLARHLEPEDLPQGKVLESSGAAIPFVHFPISGIVSVVAVGPDGKRIEAGLFGRDGMSGLAVALGCDRSPNETRVQVAGAGLRLPTAALRAAMDAEPALRERVLRFAQAFSVQTAQTALANGRHVIEERLARWLLMCHDRLEGDVIELTHELLSVMLGVRRAGVTVALHMLEGRGLVRASRGRVRILDRAGLENLAQGLYGVPEAEYARLLGAPARDAGAGRAAPEADHRPGRFGPISTAMPPGSTGPSSASSRRGVPRPP